MMTIKQISKHLPLSEATFFIMLALVTPKHGYGVMQMVEEISKGAVTIGPGTLYGAFANLEKEKLIEMVREEGRRKEYQLTQDGRSLFEAQLERLRMMVDLGDEAINSDKDRA